MICGIIDSHKPQALAASYFEAAFFLPLTNSTISHEHDTHHETRR